VLASTRRLKDSLLSDIVVVAFAWGLIPALLLELPLYELPYWQRSSAEGASMLSPL